MGLSFQPGQISLPADFRHMVAVKNTEQLGTGTPPTSPFTIRAIPSECLSGEHNAYSRAIIIHWEGDFSFVSLF